jgi:hypothetical protein
MLATLVDLLTFLGIVLVGFLIWAALSPFEVMGWWAGWFGNKIYDGGVPPGRAPRPTSLNPKGYLVFMSGVGKATGETLSYREQEFLRRLSKATPDLVIIDDIFPYSVNNLPLTGQPVFARLWRWALQRKLHGPELAGYLINVRNIWQLMISADRRYGPMYNQALADVMVHALLRHHYDPSSRKPIFVMGYSGAGHLAVGPVSYLKEWLQVPIYIISLGSVFASDPGVLAADHFYHLSGTRDSVHRYGYLAPGRWPMIVASDWNRARRQGKVTEINLGPVGHTGRGGYLDHKRGFADGTSFMDKTVEAVAEIILHHLQEGELQPALAAAGEPVFMEA